VSHPDLFDYRPEPLERQPLVVSFGGGVDSTAMLIEMHTRGIRPDLILFADTGAEKSATYDHIKAFSAWCEGVGFPAVTVVRYSPPIAPYNDLEGNCTSNETLPSLAFGMKSCSLKWKVKPQHQFIEAWGPAKRQWSAGCKVLRAIGFDDSSQDRKRSNRVAVAVGLDASPADQKRANASYAGGGIDADKYLYWYPLQAWGLTRDKCEAIIKGAGLDVPPKSSCFFCPAMKKPELIDLAETDPELLHRAVAMEDKYLSGKHHEGRKAEGLPVSTIGLGRRWNWRDFLEENGLLKGGGQ
jgi:hypothetical protein